MTSSYTHFYGDAPYSLIKPNSNDSNLGPVDQINYCDAKDSTPLSGKFGLDGIISQEHLCANV